MKNLVSQQFAVMHGQHLNLMADFDGDGLINTGIQIE